MHISEGFDYEKEVFIFEGEGPLSPENLKSTIGNTLQGESSRTSWHAVLLAKQSGRDHTTAPTFYVKYAVVSGNIVPLPFSKRTRFPETFEYVERKEGCDYLRLLKSVRYYIVLQDKSLLCKEKKDNTDFVGRFVLLSSVGEQGAESLLRLMPYEKQGSSSPTDVCLYYKEFKQNLMYAEDSEDVMIPAIDPSGYLPMEYRFNLSLRVRIHRQWRKEQKVKQTDATEEEAEEAAALR